MANHANDMAALMSAIMILKYPEIETRANAIANETTFARPHTQDATELNSALPETFFQYQRELRVLASSLASAAHGLEPFQVADAYGKMSETCVKCHATYRAGR
jgi:cytochrome c556